MPIKEDIEVLVNGTWRTDFKDLHTSVGLAVDDLGKLVKAANGLKINISSGGSFKKDMQDAILIQKELQQQIKTLEAQTKQLEQARQQGLKTQQEANKVEKEAARTTEAKARADKAETAALREKNKELRELQKEQDKVAAAQKKEEAQLERQNSAYLRLSTQYNVAARAAQDLAAQYGVEDSRAKAAAKSALDLHGRLLQIDETIGKSQRNVGNYKSAYNGLGISIQQVARELPNFAQNIQTGFLAISNNLPMLADQLRQAREQNNLLKASGEKTIPVWKQVGASIFSWQTALVAVIALSVTYGKDVVNFFRGVSQASLDAAAANKKYKESIKEIEQATNSQIATETTHLKVLNDVATNTNLKMNQRIAAVAEMQKLYPSRLGNISQEAILEGKVADALRATTLAIIAKAKAAGYEKRLGITAETLTITEEELDKSKKSVGDYLDFLRRNTKVGITKNSSISEVFDKLNELSDPEAANAFQSELKKRISGYKDLRKEQNSLYAEQDRLSKQVLNYTQKAGDDLTDAPFGSIAELEQKVATLKEGERLAIIGSKEQLEITKRRIKAEDDLAKAQLKGKYGRDPKVKKPLDLTNEVLASENELTMTLADIEKARYELTAEKNKDIFEDDKQTLEKRLAAYHEYEGAKYAIILTEQDRELEIVQNSLDKIKTIEGKASSERTNEENKLLLDKETLQAQKTEITARYLYLEEKLQTDSDKKRKEIAESSTKEQIRVIMQGAQDIETAIRDKENEKLIILDNAYKNGNIKFKAYQKQRKQIQIDADNEVSESQRAYLLKWIDDLEKAGKLTAEMASKLRAEAAKNAPRGQQGKEKKGLFFDMVKSIFGDALDDEQVAGIVKAYADAFASIYSSLQQIQANRYASQIDGMQSEMDLQKKKYEDEVDMINLLSITDEKRQEKLSEAKAKQVLREEAGIRKINILKQKQAEAQKQAAILEATGKGTVAVIRAFSDLGPIAGAIAAIAIGASVFAEISALKAIEVPKYAKGRGFGKDEIAIVNDAGTEAIVNRSGDIRIANQGKEGLTALSADEMVLTAAETSRIMKNGSLKSLNASGKKITESDYYLQRLIIANETGSKQIIKAIRDNRPIINNNIYDKSYQQHISRH